MTDISLVSGQDGGITFMIENGDFKVEKGFKTSIILSLLSESRATEDQIKKTENRGGWIGNINSPAEGRQLGSWIWTINQMRLNTNTLNTAINYAQLSLNHLVEDGQAKEVIVSGEIVPKFGISINVVITAPSGEVESHYVKLWELTLND